METEPPAVALQATWTPDLRLFLWSREGAVEDALAELPGSPEGRRASRKLALRKGRTARPAFDGRDVALAEVVEVLGALPNDEPVSDSIRCWSLAAKLALELAARQRVV